MIIGAILYLMDIGPVCSRSARRWSGHISHHVVMGDATFITYIFRYCTNTFHPWREVSLFSFTAETLQRQ